MLADVGRGLVLSEEIIGQGHHSVGISGKRGGVRRAWDVPADGGVFGLGGGDGDGSAFADEAEELRGDVFMHAETASGGGEGLHPTGVETVGGLELAPVRHWGSFEAPACGLVLEVDAADDISFDGVAVGIGAVFVFFTTDTEVASGSGGGAAADGDGHDEEGLLAFHDVGHLVGEGDFDADV